jgi:hypothetical protein
MSLDCVLGFYFLLFILRGMHTLLYMRSMGRTLNFLSKLLFILFFFIFPDFYSIIWARAYPAHRCPSVPVGAPLAY